MMSVFEVECLLAAHTPPPSPTKELVRFYRAKVPLGVVIIVLE